MRDAIFLATYAGPSVASATARDTFLCETARDWRRQFTGNDLQIIVTDVDFHESPRHFATGEAAVITPVGVDLAGTEHVLDVRAEPRAIRTIQVEGITAVAWEYPGELHRDLNYRGLALVRRPSRRRVTIPESPTFASLPDPWRVDARLTAAELETEEHGLDQCKAFLPALKLLAGEPPYTSQLLHILQRLQEWRRDEPRGKEGEDLCASLRANALRVHDIQVLAVMMMRELGAPALGFTTADPKRMYLVGTYVDGLGWVTVDANRPGGYELGGPPIVTLAPLAAPFEAGQHGFWYPSAGAYSQMFGRTAALSTTRWSTVPGDSDDVTVPSSVPLAQACP